MNPSKRLKIALIRQHYMPYGGASRFTSLLMQKLSSKHEIHLLSEGWGSLETDKINESRTPAFAGVTAHKVPTLRFLSVLRIFTFWLGCFFRLRQNKFDLILSLEKTPGCHLYRAGDGCHKEWLNQRSALSSPLRRFLTQLNPLHRLILRLEKRTLMHPHLKGIVSVSHRVKREIQQHYPLCRTEITVLYNPVDVNKLAPAQKKIAEIRQRVRRKLQVKDSYLLLFVGSGFERKGLDSLIQALPLVIKSIPNAVLWVIGKGKTKKYEKLASQLGLKGKILFLGPQIEVSDYYHASDLFVFPAHYEPIGNVIFEAMASRLIVVTSQKVGAAELLKDGESGFLIRNPLDTQEIGQKIIEASQTKNKEPIIENAWHIVSRFTPENYIAQFLHLLDSIEATS